ncbi:MAG TPA: hemerythrin domain-containing protein [Solirubrobacterales bacterium]|nr:hemerythrin domain-containing protein [Solirubrobacterales bacterium]
MKRSAALKPLSRDHHQALVAAQRLRRAESVAEAAPLFLEFWDEHGRNHFQVEEEVLLPTWAEHGPHDHPAVVRVLTDHVAIRRDAARVRGGEASLEDLHELGGRLDRHVRFEEKELFPLIERTLDEPSQQRLAREVLAAEERG